MGYLYLLQLRAPDLSLSPDEWGGVLVASRGKLSMAATSGSRLGKLAFLRVLRWKMPNNSSTCFSQLAVLGVK